ncbi:MAG: signal peptide peptidase SppA, partial [Thermoanaerobaculia bacterium]
GALSGCLIVAGGIVLFGILIAAMASNDTSTRGDVFGDKVAIIPIDGEILGSRDVIDALHRYARNSSVKAMVMRINSPGGAIAPSQEIYEEIRNVRARSGKPIIASLDSVAASGGYYIASACDTIVANPGSITGSIGVILQWLETKDLIAWAKMKPETITSGAMKAAGSPYQDLTEEQRAYFQSIVMQLHSQFVRAVAAGRKGKLSEADVSRIADGRVFTGEQALGLKLVDQLGNLDDAIRLAGKAGGISGRPGTIYPKKRTRGFFDALTSDESDTETAISRILTRRPRFLFQW